MCARALINSAALAKCDRRTKFRNKNRGTVNRVFEIAENRERMKMSGRYECGIEIADWFKSRA